MYTPTVSTPDPTEGTILSNAAEYIRDKWQTFLGLGPSIIDLQHRAALAAQSYNERGMTSERDAAKALIHELGSLNILHGKIIDNYGGLAPYVGLGAVAIPVVLATAFSAAALAVLWFFRKMDVQEKALDMLEAGTLSEAGFREMNAAIGPSPLRETLDFAKLALWGLLAWVALQAFRTYKGNPPLVVFGNPPEVFSGDVHTIKYEHAEDGSWREHHFEGGVEAEALPDGSVILSHPERPVWGEF